MKRELKMLPLDICLYKATTLNIDLIKEFSFWLLTKGHYGLNIDRVAVLFNAPKRSAFVTSILVTF